MTEFVIRKATLNDFGQIKKLNDDFVNFTSPMDLPKLEQLHNISAYHRVIESHSAEATAGDNKVVGFMLVMAPKCQYQSENYQWFDRRYQNFLYVDRVVIDKSVQGIGLGRRLYDDLFHHARTYKIGHICAEFNLIPANPISAAYHKSFGFHQVGRLSNDDQSKVVSMQIANAM
ncbi:GNAT family N-acetyltransferase [Aliiglaciecola litoralis]|uniref:N-acetyltransferase domain-containing protein n=1 Tax=Aliiglaciecola litoralis TaxID=582857 RepID=A0ABP3X2S1_9ALTE